MHDTPRTVHEHDGVRIVVSDSVTALTPQHAGTVSVHGSHCGANVAGFAIRAGVAGMIGNDAGVGLEQAGIAGLALLDEREIAGAAVAARSARIGEGTSTWESGVVSHANATARACGVEAGMSARDAAIRFLTRARETSAT